MQPSPTAPEGQVADAVRGNWVDTRAPAGLRPYLRLSRADRPVGTWLLFIPCLWGLALSTVASGHLGSHGVWIALGCGIGAWLMRGAGCTWNDVTDRDFDAQVARTQSRPIPSGQITVLSALIWMCAQSLVAFAILLTFNLPAIALGVSSLALVCVYPFAKRFTWWPQVFLGATFNWGILLAWAAHSGAPGWPAVLLYLAGISWTLFYDTIYAHQDKEDDALIGVKSTARLFGKKTPIWLLGFAIGAVVLMASAIVTALAGNTAALVVGLCGTGAFGAHLAWQMTQLDTNSPESCLLVFRSNRDAGLLLVLFLTLAYFV